MNSKIKITGVRLTLTAHDWQLYPGPGADHVAEKLNAAIAENVAEGRITTRRAAEAVMAEHSRFGATDTEPRWVLHDLLDDIFGKEEDR